MAEIKIEKKKPWWPWILLLLIILAVAAYFLWYSDDNGVDDDVSIESEEPVGDYVQEGFNATNIDKTHTRAVAAIVPNQKIEGQKEQINAFFDACGDALMEMNPENEEQ